MDLSVQSPEVAMLVGLVLPYLLAVVKQPTMTQLVKVGLTILGSVLSAVSVIFVAGNGTITQGSLLGTTVVILGVSQLFYVSLGKALGLTELERKTNV